EQARIIQTAIRPTRAEVDLAALRHNLRALREHVEQSALGRPPAVFAVVKADAYGHGAVPIATALERAGVDGLAVSPVGEGLELRRATRLPILVLGGCYGRAHREIVAHGLVPVVFDLSDVEKLAAAAAPGQRVPVHIKIDTGMSRLGIAPASLAHFLAETA